MIDLRNHFKIFDLFFFDILVPSECYISAFEETVGKNSVQAIDVLLPNGLVVCIQADQCQNLSDLRQILRQRYGINWPFNFLSITHTFTNDFGDLLLDEEQPFDTLGLVYPFVRVSARGELPAPVCQWLSSIDRSDVELLIDFVERLVEWRDMTIPQDVLHAPPSIATTILTKIDTFTVFIDSIKKAYVCQSTTTPNQLVQMILNDENKSSLEYYNTSSEPMLKFVYRNEFLWTSESNYPILQYSYVQECLQKNVKIQLQLIYVQLPKRSKKQSALDNRHIEPDIFSMPLRPVLLPGNKENNTEPILISQQSSTCLKFLLRLSPSAQAKETNFQFHSAIYYGRHCLYAFESFTWNNTCMEEITLTTSLPLTNLLPGSLLCFSLINKQSKMYFLNVSLFRSNGCLLNGAHQWTFNPTDPIQHIPNNKNLYPDSFIGSSNQESNEEKYEIKLKFDYPQIRFYSNDEIVEKMKTILVPTPTVITTAKQHQQHQESNEDVANGEALNYLLGILSDEVKEKSFNDHQKLFRFT